MIRRAGASKSTPRAKPLDNSNPLSAVWSLKKKYPQYFKTTDRKSIDKPWPKGLDPKTAPVYSHSEVHVNASPEQVFKLLTEAKSWPSWYGGVADVKLDGKPEAKGPLALGSKFDWRIEGTTQHSEVTLYVPNRALGWTAKGLGDEAYHRWYLIPEGRGTRIVSEEVQTGPGPWLMRDLLNPALTAAHRSWIDAISTKLGGSWR